MQCDQCLHVTITMNQLYLVGGASTVALCIFLYMQSPIQISPVRRCCLMVTLNQLYLVKGGARYHCTAQLPLFTTVLGNH
jgi:hypothetical protein